MLNQRVGAGVREFFVGIPLFSGLPEDEIDTLAKAAHPHSYRKGEYLYRQGEEANRLSIIKEGWVRLYRGNQDGEEGPARLYTRGGILGERTILPGRLKHFFSAQIIGDADVINISGSAIQDVTRRNPVILGKMMVGLMEKMGEIHVENEHMSLLSAPQRVACLLLRLSAYMVGKGGTFTFPYDKSLAATQLGMKRETFSRALASLKRHGVCTKGSEIRMENFIRLSEFCCMRCSLNTECKGARCMSSPAAIMEANRKSVF